MAPLTNKVRLRHKSLNVDDPTKIADSYPSFTLREARNVLGHLCDRVGYGGERIVLRKHNRVVAVLVPVSDLGYVHTEKNRNADTKK